ncbi:MAG: hypothetical protein R3C05_05160 [Pirellulaceae bacterium]
MDRETLVNALAEGPIRIYLNDGQAFEIDNPQWCGVDSTTAYVMFRDEATGKIKTHWLSLVCMTRIERIETAA